MPSVLAHPALDGPLAWSVALGALAVSILELQPASPEGVEFESGYDHERASATLDHVAAVPHPTGSFAQARVRAYLVEEVRAAGAPIEPQAGRIGPNRLTNLLVHLPGTASTGTVLVIAHYDTVPQSPGAGDDSCGVVALLETVRVLAAKPRRNDVVVLFTDGEERGLLGAKLFAREHPLMQDVAVVLNFEAIGNAGPVYMFETGPGSGALVRLLGETVPYPLGNSLASVIYGWMPNNTDFSVFRDRGIPGLNFAIAGASGYYHSPADTPRAFDAASLAHIGDTAVRMSERLAEVDLGALPRDERAFFAAPPFGLVVLRGREHVWLWCLAQIALIAALVRRRVVSLGGLIRGTWGAGLAVLSAGVGACVVGAGVLAVARPTEPLALNEVYLLLLALGLGAVAGLCVSLGKRRGHDPSRLCARERLIGAVVGWNLLCVVFLFVEPSTIGASYVFTLAGTALAGATAMRLFTRAPRWACALVIAPAMFICGPILGPLVQLSSKSPWAVIGLGAALLALGTPLLGPLAERIPVIAGRPV